jgi:stearoyl-CoA desaturase (delta-9 desaturase)
LKELLLGAVVVLVVLKLAERRTPRAAYRATLLLGVTVPIVASVYALWRLHGGWVSWLDIGLFAGMYLATGLGTTLGYHRLVAHGSFSTGPLVKGVFLALGAMALQGRITHWAAFHRAHHANSDREGDPHSPLEGFLHSHVGWILRAPEADRDRYCRRLFEDRVVMFIDRTTELWVLLGLSIPFALGGWSGLLWGGFVRIAFGNHMTFAINSVCHTFGRRPFETRDESRNNWLMGAVGLGEGWHNNHHAFPSMALHGMRWWQVDATGMVIVLLERLGLVWDVRRPTPTVVARRRRTVAAA